MADSEKNEHGVLTSSRALGPVESELKRMSGMYVFFEGRMKQITRFLEDRMPHGEI